MVKEKKKKTFLLDTNVLIHDPDSIMQFPGREIIIPLTTIEQLNSLKKLHDERGRSARKVIRFFDSLHGCCPGNFQDGFKLENGTTLKIYLDIKKKEDSELPMSIQQDRIVMATYHLSKNGNQVVLITKNLASRVKADSIGLKAEDYISFKVSYDNLYAGLQTIETDKLTIDNFLKDGYIKNRKKDIYPNEYLQMQCPEKSTAIGKYDIKADKLTALIKINSDIWGIKPLNTEQRCAIDLLLRDDIQLVTLIGTAGTGKTLLTLACGLRKVFDEGIYNKILISRPIVPLGKDIGFLPGAKEEKLFHWMQPIYDNLELLCSSTENESKEAMRWVLDSKKFEMEAVTYIRGRSLPKMYMIIDEAQNLTAHEIKTIISRAGHNTKVILTGDPTQIDNPYLDRDTNGLTVTVEKFKNNPLFGHMMLTQTERSELAAFATEVM